MEESKSESSIYLTKRIALYILSFLILLAIIQSSILYNQSVKAAKLVIGCKSFKTQIQAQHYYDTKQRGYKNLYVNKYGKVCTHALPPQ